MKFKLEDNIELYQEITNIYRDSVIRDLHAAETDLVKIFEDIFSVEAKNFGLVTKSSVNDIPYYSVKSRVKKVKSFSEKLVRKDIGIRLIKEFGKTKETILQNKANLTNSLKKLDDIVGLRIVTELREDTLNVYKLLENNVALFEGKKVTFFDLDQQPQIMKNGLTIYRIKGQYDGLICFELQIKSKIDEAWGEMDHTIFYKDHTSSLIKPTVQKTMNNVGVILEKLETLLFDLRHSSQIFDANSSYIEFENNLFKKYNVEISKVFKHPIPLTNISRIVYSLKNTESLDENLDEDLNFEFLEYEVVDEFCKKLVDLFHSSHSLIITEALYYCGLKSKNDGFELENQNYEKEFEKFVLGYFKYVNHEIDNGGDYISDLFYDLLKKNHHYISNSEVVTDLKKIKNFKKIVNLITNTLEDVEDIDHNIITNIYFIVYFGGDYTKYYMDIKDNIEFNIQKCVDLIEEQSKLYQDEQFSKEIEALTKSLKKVLK